MEVAPSIRVITYVKTIELYRMKVLRENRTKITRNFNQLDLTNLSWIKKEGKLSNKIK